jgi:hypothetical protein
MKELLPLVVMALLAAPSVTEADVEGRLYDFTDAYYLGNGVNPALIQGRMQPGPTAVTDTPIFPFQRNVRALLTLPAYDHSGNINYFTVLGGISAGAFTLDAAGGKPARLPTVSSNIFSRSRALIRLVWVPSVNHRCSICGMDTLGEILSVFGSMCG